MRSRRTPDIESASPREFGHVRAGEDAAGAPLAFRPEPDLVPARRQTKAGNQLVFGRPSRGSDGDFNGLPEGTTRSPLGVEHRRDGLDPADGRRRREARRLAVVWIAKGSDDHHVRLAPSRMPEGGRRHAQRQVATRQPAENGGVERRNGRPRRFAALGEVAASRLHRHARAVHHDAQRAESRVGGPIARPGSRSDSTSCSPRRSRARPRRARSCAARAGRPCSRAARFLTRSRRRRRAIRADRTYRCSCSPDAADRSMSRTMAGSAGPSGSAIVVSIVRPRPDIEDRLAARRRTAEDVADSSERVDGAPADLERASQRHARADQRRTLFSRRFGRNDSIAARSSARRFVKFCARPPEVKTTAARSDGPSSSTTRCPISRTSRGSPSSIPSQRVVEQDHHQALRGDVVGRDIRVHVSGPLGTRRSGDGTARALR